MKEPIHILYVGLDEEPRDRITDALEERRDSIAVETAADPAETIAHLEEQSFDCVVSSGTLADGTSVELLRTVRKTFPALPYVLFVDELSVELISEAIDAGATDYLPPVQEDAHFSLLADRIFELVQQHRETERTGELERINTVVRDLNRALVRASSTDEIDRRVCEVLSRSEPYVFAWIGEHDPESGTVTRRAAAGIEDGYLEAITITIDGEATAQGPTGRAVRTHEMQVMQNIPEDPAYEPWREQALERGYRSSAAIPLVYDGTLYGVLNVYADRTNAFDADEQALLEELGDTIAYAYHDVRVHTEARRFQRAVEQAADAIFITDTEGTIEYVNPAFEDLTGYTASEAIGRNPRILKSGELPREYYEGMWETILGGEIWKSEIVNARRSGELYHAEQTVAPINDDKDTIEGFVAIQRDITERKERRSELERYEYLWNNLPVGVGRFEPEGEYPFVMANPRLAEIAGARSKAALLDRSLLELWHDERELETFLERIADERRATTRTQFETLDGELIWVSVRALCNESAGEPVVDVVIQDVTQIREKEIYLEEAQEVANIGWWQKNIPSDQIYWSEQIYDMWGVDGDVGLIDHDTFLSIIHPEDRDAVDEQWDVAKEGGPYDIEHRIITPDGVVKWMREKAELTFDESGSPVSAIGIVQDITERKQREQELEDRTEQYEAVIENVHDGLVIVQDEVIQFANARMSELTGYSLSDIIGGSITDLIGEDYRQTVLDRYRTRLEGGETPTETYKIDLRQHDGDLLPVELSVGTFDYEGRPAAIAAVRDISDRIERTQQLRVMDRVLRHNLRNDMTTIQGNAEAIRTEVDSVDEKAEKIIDTSRQLMRTVDKEREIVDVIAERPERTDIDVVDVCQHVVATAHENHPEAAIDLDHPEEASALATEKLGRGIRELLENAIVHNERETPEVSLTVESRDETVRIEIVDNGPGIPEEEVNVLTRQYDVEPLYHGSGLGLWLVNWIVKQSGGRLEFEERDPRGSIVTIELQRSF
ncbi:PAS domain S-box protein [Halopenitus sp. H-Gu1]|uniref:PAS domain S-box protein n=1 Tax=Halopenitus sp. H-Gu1 TaxID=3242697 RepID=UPI00359DE8F8